MATASPESAEDTTDSRVVAIRRSNTTVDRPDGPLVAPSSRTARVTASPMARVGVEPVEAPADAEAATGLAGVPLAGDDAHRQVARRLPLDERMPVVDTSADSDATSP